VDGLSRDSAIPETTAQDNINSGGDHTGRYAHYPRWNTKTLDRDLFVETLISWVRENSLAGLSKA